MNNEEIILKLVQEIRDDQKSMVSKINELALNQMNLKAELDAGRNGYSSHEVVSMLHWIDDQMRTEKTKNDGILKAVINWLVPIIGTALVIGLFDLHKYL